MSNYPILNFNPLDVLASKNGPNTERTIREHKFVSDSVSLMAEGTYFKVGSHDLMSANSYTQAGLLGAQSPEDVIEIESVSGLVIQQDNGWVIVNDVHIPLAPAAEGNQRDWIGGGAAQDVMVEYNSETAQLSVAGLRSNILGVFLKGKRFDPSKVVPTDVAKEIVEGEAPQTLSQVMVEGERLSQLLPELELAQKIVDLYWPMYKHFVETTDAYILENFPQGRGEFDVIALANATFQKQGWDPTQYHEYAGYVAERSKARLDTAIAKPLTYAELMAKIKNDVTGQPRFDDEWVSEALQDSIISVGNVIEALDAQGFAILIGGNADEIIEQVKAHYLELADVVEGYHIESENGRHLITLKGDSRPKPTANQIRRRACLKTALGTINAVLLAGKAYRLSLADAWDHSKKAMVLTDDQHDVWPVVATAFHIEGYEQDPQLDTKETLELLGEVLNSLLTRQETGMRIESIEWFDETYEILVGAWEAVADPNGKFNFVTLGGRPTKVDMGDPVEGFDPTEYLIGLGELEIVGRQLKTEVLDPTVVNGLAESHPILRLRFNGDVQAFIVILDNGQPVRAEDVLAVGGWLATELNSVLIARGDTEARLKIIDDNMSSNYTVSSFEVANATYGPVMVSAR